MSTQARIDMVGVGGQAVVLQRTQSRWETSVWAQNDMVRVQDEHSGSEGQRRVFRLEKAWSGYKTSARVWRNTETSIQAQIDKVEVGDEHLGLKKHGQGGQAHVVVLLEVQNYHMGTTCDKGW